MIGKTISHYRILSEPGAGAADYEQSGSQLTQSDGMRRPVSGRDAAYAPKLSACSEAQEIKETGNEKG
jgi:hypothetical protein